MITDNTYFNQEEIRIPANQMAGTLEQLTACIAITEPEFMESFLGYKLYKEYFADSTLNPVPQRWVDLINGKEFSFEYRGKTIVRKWEGLKGRNKKSVIAFFTYYRFRNDRVTSFSGTTQTKADAENSQVADETLKLIFAWNEHIKMRGYVPRLFDKFGTYIHYNDFPSAYNFMLANIADYEGWEYEPQFYKNEYGL